MYDDRTNLTRQVANDLTEFSAISLPNIIPAASDYRGASFGKTILTTIPAPGARKAILSWQKKFWTMNKPTIRRALGKGSARCYPRVRPPQPNRTVAIHADDTPQTLPVEAIDPTAAARRLPERTAGGTGAIIRSNGIVQPLVVRRMAIATNCAGERRWRREACRDSRVPVVIRDIPMTGCSKSR